MNHHLFCATLKDNAKERLTGRFGLLIGTQLLVMCITVFTTFLFSSFMAFPIMLDNAFLTTLFTHAISLITGTFIGVLQLGIALMYLKIASGNPHVSLSDLFYGFQNQFHTALGISFIMSLIAVIPSIIAELALNAITATNPDIYPLLSPVTDLGLGILSTLISLFVFPCYYLMLDFPGKSTGEILRMSLTVMKGQKGKLLYIILSFLPLTLLATISVIGSLWVEPYLLMTQALFFFEIMKKENVVK